MEVIFQIVRRDVTGFCVAGYLMLVAEWRIHTETGGKMTLGLIYFLFSRLRLHESKVIKDRRHHLRTYPNCFVAKEILDWLIEHKEASDRDTAITIMQKLFDQSIIHHGGFVQHREFLYLYSTILTVTLTQNVTFCH